MIFPPVPCSVVVFPEPPDEAVDFLEDFFLLYFLVFFLEVLLVDAELLGVEPATPFLARVVKTSTDSLL